MALTGNLEVFPLEEVLRLLARSRKTGCLRIEAPAQHGRVFIAGGAVTLATTSGDDDLRRQLMQAGIIGGEGFRTAETAAVSLPEVVAPEVPPASLADFIREHVVEALYRIRRPRQGNFDFAVDMPAMYQTGQTFDVEVLIAESDRRGNEWADIEAVIPDLAARYRMVPELETEEAVTVGGQAWRVLAALGDGSAVHEVAERLGSTDFRAAREMANLVRNSLIDPVPAAVPTTAPAPVERVMAVPEPPAEPTPPEPVPAEPVPVEPQAEQTDWFAAPEAPSPEVVTPEKAGAAEAPADGGWWDRMQRESQPEETVTDSDEFLESVFAQLSEADDPDPESSDDSGFNLGLLRRRRMGASAKELTEGES